MHVYKHLNINNQFTPLELSRRTIKGMEKHCIHKDDTECFYMHIVLQIMYSHI